MGHSLLSPQDSPPLLSSPCLACLILSLGVCGTLNVGSSSKVQAISLAQGQLLPITSPHFTSYYHLISSFPSQKPEHKFLLYGLSTAVNTASIRWGRGACLGCSCLLLMAKVHCRLDVESLWKQTFGCISGSVSRKDSLGREDPY